MIRREQRSTHNNGYFVPKLNTKKNNPTFSTHEMMPDDYTQIAAADAPFTEVHLMFTVHRCARNDTNFH